MFAQFWNLFLKLIVLTAACGQTNEGKMSLVVPHMGVGSWFYGFFFSEGGLICSPSHPQEPFSGSSPTRPFMPSVQRGWIGFHLYDRLQIQTPNVPVSWRTLLHWVSEPNDKIPKTVPLKLHFYNSSRRPRLWRSMFRGQKKCVHVSVTAQSVLLILVFWDG